MQIKTNQTPLTKSEFKNKYGVSRQEMFVLIGLLMRRDLYKSDFTFFLEGEDAKYSITKKIIKRLIKKKFLQQIGLSCYYTLTNDGFAVAYKKIRECEGKIYNAPAKTQEVLKHKNEQK